MVNVPRVFGVGFALLVTCSVLHADKHVVVIARADPDYVKGRVGEDGQNRAETYVFLEGRHHPGATVDRTLERTTFREIVDFLAPELARRQYLPSRSYTDADLLLFVHWGATIPHVSVRELTAQTTTNVEVARDRAMAETLQTFGVPVELPGDFAGLSDNVRPEWGDDADRAQGFDRLTDLADELSRQRRGRDNIALLGYADELHRLGGRAWSTETERSLRHDLNTERYFVIIRAYDLKGRTPNVPRNRPVWTMHINIRSPGNNFKTALTRMSVAASRFAGTNTGEVETVRISGRDTTGTVTLAPLIILDEAAPK